MNDEWISVKDRLPKNDDEVLVYHKSKNIDDIGTAYFKIDMWHWDDYTILENVSHWQPLPPPPTTTKK
ncbi:hypothetical protein LCGC14_2845770 [marine sediment metagenome]|uniref:DUF551 domain-containing protein n=1 Tax=marine sediment metagenome TaxID=412755 RepID=A0A0F8YWI6_9ZZZZ